MPNKQNWVYRMSGNAWDKRMERMGMLKYQNTDQNGGVNPNIADRFRRYGMEVPAWAQGGQTQQPTTPTNPTNPTPGQSAGGGQGQNVRFNQKVNKMDRAAQGQARQTFATSDRRDTIGDARDAGAPTVTPRKPSVIGATGTAGAAPKRNPFNTTPTPPAWLNTPAVQNWPPAQNVNRNAGTNAGAPAPRIPSGLPSGVPNWALPAAPRIPSGLPTNTIPSGIPAPSIPVAQGPRQPRPTIPVFTGGGAVGVPGGLSQSQQQANMPRLQAMALKYPSDVVQGGSYVPSYNGGPGGTYTDPNGRRYYVTGNGQFMYMGDPAQAVVGQPAISQAAQNLRYLATYSPMGALSSTPSIFGSNYGGGFGGGYGGGGGGGYTSYDPYGGQSWYNNLDLTAWNIS